MLAIISGFDYSLGNAFRIIVYTSSSVPENCVELFALEGSRSYTRTERRKLRVSAKFICLAFSN